MARRLLFKLVILVAAVIVGGMREEVGAALPGYGVPSYPMGGNYLISTSTPEPPRGPDVPPAPTGNNYLAGRDLADNYFNNRRQPFTVSWKIQVNRYRYHSGDAPALRYYVTIEGHMVAVYYPTNLDPKQGRFHRPQQVAEALAALPKTNRDLILRVDVEPRKSPDDAYWADQYNLPDFESYMAAHSSGIVSIYPTHDPIEQVYMDVALIRETGHILSRRLWGSDPKGREWRNWERLATRDGNPVSRFGSSSLGADFAETLVQYTVYKGTKYEARARALWPNRFAAIDTILSTRQADLLSIPALPHGPGVPSNPTGGNFLAGEAVMNDYFDDQRQPFTINGPTRVDYYGYRSGNAHALRYQVIIDGHSIDVHYPTNIDRKYGHFHTVQQVAEALAALPKICRELILRVDVEPRKSPDDAYWADQYNLPDFESYMAAHSSGIVNIYPTTIRMTQGFMDTSMIHESGHILSRRLWGSDPKNQAWQNWAKLAAKDRKPVSQHSKVDVEEDFSEALIQYMVYKGTWYEARARALWPNRFAAIDAILSRMMFKPGIRKPYRLEE